MLIRLDQVTIARRLLRRDLDAGQLQALAEDIARNGQIQPIAVREVGPDAYVLIAGRRRLEAVRSLGWERIEAHVMDGGAADVVRGAAENIKRVQLSPLEEADIVRDLHDVDGLSIHDIAEQTGHGTSWVQDRLALVSLPRPFQDAVHGRRLSISAALLLQSIGDGEYRDYLLHVAVVNGATVHQVEAWVQEWTARQAMTRPGGWDGAVPQPPPPPTPQPQPCFACQAPVPADHVILVRFCRACLDELSRAAGRVASAPSNVSPASPCPPSES